MSLKAFIISSMLIAHPAMSDSPEDRLCISETTQETVIGNQTLISGILSCRGVDPIQDFDPQLCVYGVLKPAEFMLEDMYTSCPFQNAILER